ncbi:MAG: cytochrome c [Pseudomonadota bacterium]
MAYRRSLSVAATLLLTISPALMAGDEATDAGTFTAAAPQLGQVIDTDTLTPLAITVFPDGRGLPAGSGTAVDGAAVYERHCLACHGPDGRGGLNDALVGGQGTLQTGAPKKTVGSFWPYATTLFDYVRRAMPYRAPGTLSADELYAVTAYLLHANGIVDEAQVLDAQTLPAVTMPNRDGFDWTLPVD